MSCTTCTKIKTIYRCPGNFLIAKLNPITNYDVHIVDLATGRHTRKQQITDISGQLTVDPSDLDLMDNRTYEIWITSANDLPENKMDIVLGGVAYNCFTFRSADVRNAADGQQVAVTQQELTIDA